MVTHSHAVHLPPIFFFFCPGTNKGGCALLVLPFNGAWNPPYPQNIIQAQLPSTLSPGSYHWNLLISLDPILDLMLPDTQFSASHPVLSKSHRASPVAAALSSTEEHFLRQAGEQVRFPNGYGMEILHSGEVKFTWLKNSNNWNIGIYWTLTWHLSTYSKNNTNIENMRSEVGAMALCEVGCGSTLVWPRVLLFGDSITQKMWCFESWIFRL